VPENVVPTVRIELTLGHPYRFLSMMRFVLISFIMKPTHWSVIWLCLPVWPVKSRVSANWTRHTDNSR